MLESKRNWEYHLESLIAAFLVVYSFLWGFSLKGARDGMELFALLAACLIVYQYRNRNTAPTIEGGLIVRLAAMLGVWLLVSLFSEQPEHSMAYILRIGVQFLPLVLVSYAMTRQRLNRIFVAMTLATGVDASYAIWQGLHGNFRANGFGQDSPFVLGYHLVFYMIFFGCLLLGSRLSRRMSLLVFFVLVLSLIALLFNGTRAAWLALIVAIVLGIALTPPKYKRLLVYFACGSLGIFLVLFVSTNLAARFMTFFDPAFVSNSERILMWQSAIAMIRDHPWLGIGPDRYFDYYNQIYISPLAHEIGIHRHPHNLILKHWCETGIVGVIPLILVFSYLLWHTYQRYRTSSSEFALAAFLLTIAFLLQSMLDYSFDQLSIMSYFWFLVGLGLQTERGMAYAKYSGH